MSILDRLAINFKFSVVKPGGGGIFFADKSSLPSDFILLVLSLSFRSLVLVVTWLMSLLLNLSFSCFDISCLCF